MSNPVLEQALDYFARGWEPIPVSVTLVRQKKGKPIPPKKVPSFLVEWGSAEVTEESIRHWWSDAAMSEDPTRGIALRTGKQVGVIVIDVDNLYEFDMLLTDLGIPFPTENDTYTVSSQSGKKQLYFKRPDRFPATLTGSKFLDPTWDEYNPDDEKPRGVEVMSDGRVVFAPPTIVYEEDGRVAGEYTLLSPPGVEPMDLPQALLDHYLARNGYDENGRSTTGASSGRRTDYERPIPKAGEMPPDWNAAAADRQLSSILGSARDRFAALQADPDSLWDNGVASVMGILVRAMNAPWFPDFDEHALDEFLAKYAPEDDGFDEHDHQRIKHSIIKTANGEAIPYVDTALEADQVLAWVREISTRQVAAEEGISTPNGLLPNIPDEFWNARPLFTAIRHNARRVIAGPDAALHAFMAGYMSLVPYQYRIDSGLGPPAKMIYFSAVVGPSGVGKGVSTGIGLSMLDPKPEEHNIGSGEGIAEFFLDSVPDEDNPANFRKDKVTGEDVLVSSPTMVKRQARHNLLLNESEGGILSTLTERKGSTLATTLLKFGVGETLGNLNASAATNRHVEAGTYAAGLVGSFQVNVSGQLLSQTETGLAQRFMWCTVTDGSLDPNVDYDMMPEMEVEYHQPTPISTELGSMLSAIITVEPEIVNPLRKMRKAAVMGQINIDPADSHRPVRMLQTAGILRLLDGPNRDVDPDTGEYHGYIITVEDWRLAEILYDTSRAVRRMLVQKVEENRVEQRDEQAKDLAEQRAVEREHLEDTATKRKVQNAFQRLRRADEEAGGEPVSYTKYLRGWSGSNRQKAKDEIVPALVEIGYVQVSEEANIITLTDEGRAADTIPDP